MDYDKALNFYKEALDISEKCGDRIGVAKQYVNIGNVYCKTNRSQEGLDIFKEAKRIYETKFNNKDFFILDVNNRIRLAIELIKAK
jgi:tetratricopeptide (TPR) repeat protein